jgi:hypothetical protein
MGRKARDPQNTGKAPSPPWKPVDSCPCGSGQLFGQCCLRTGGHIYKSPTRRVPPAPQTGFGHNRCYLEWSKDCDQTISAEHFISATVLSQLGDKKVRLNGMPWLRGATKNLPISSLTGNILCRRHNAALSPLDAMAGRFFSALKL